MLPAGAAKAKEVVEQAQYAPGVRVAAFGGQSRPARQVGARTSFIGHLLFHPSIADQCRFISSHRGGPTALGVLSSHAHRVTL